MKRNLVGKILGKIKIFVQDFVPIRTALNYTGYYGDKILYKKLDLTQDFPNKILFHFLWEQNLVQNLPQDFQINAHGDHDAAIAKAAATVTHVQNLSQEVGSEDEGLGLFGFDLSSAETDFWWLGEEQSRRNRNQYTASTLGYGFRRSWRI